jgi:benzoyl-CoA reductase/2-hydroxyglutaryl-CoA dehydratase subunit BcrC/BadD/HgdB
MTTVMETVIPPELRSANQDRTAAGRTYYATGGHVCGYFGTGMPIEIAIATGHMPVAIMPPHDRPTPHAEEWLHPTFNPQARLILDQLLSGDLEFVDVAIAVAQASHDSHIYHTAHEILRLGHGGIIPPLFSYSLMGLQSPAVREYGRMEIDALQRRLRANSGQEATAASLAAAVELTNAVREQWRKLDGLRRQGAVSGTNALNLMAPSRFMDGHAYLTAITQVVASLEPTTVTGPKLLVLSSEALSDTRLHEAIEAGGAVVVAEDDIWGSRSATPDIVLGDDPIGSIYRHYYDHVPNRSVYPATVRLGWFYANAPTPEIDGVIVHMTRADRSLGWDYPRIRDFLQDHNKPVLMTREDASTDSGSVALTAAVSAFTTKIQENGK